MPEVRIGKANRLSRRSDLKVGVENEWIRGIIEVIVEGLEIELVEKIKRVRRKDEKVVKVVEEMKKVGVKALRDDK